MKKYNVGWGLTNICNMNCQFCYSKKSRKETKECGINDWISFVKNNADFIDSINYGTGENSLKDDFFYFIEFVRQNYPTISQSVTTNGSIFDRIQKNEKFYEIFKKSIDEVDVSLDFFVKDKHNAFRGQPHAYDWAINTLDLCNKLNKKLTIVFIGCEETLQKDNIDGLFKIAKTYNSLIRMNIYRPVSNVPDINKRFILKYNTLMNALKYIDKKYKIVSLSDALLGNLYTDIEVKDNTGINSIRILPEGTICASTYLIDDNYKNDKTIKDGKILNNLTFNLFSETVVPEECKNCKFVKSCAGGVKDRRLLWYKTLEKRDPYCPLNYEKDIPDYKFKTTKTTRVSVHDGYLPTIFFEN